MKKNIGRLLTGAIAISAACSMTAFADEATTAPTAQPPAAEAEAPEAEAEAPEAEAEAPAEGEEVAAPTEETEAVPAEELTEAVEVKAETVEAQTEAQGFVQVEGKIDSIVENDGYKTVTLINDQGGVVLNITDKAFVLNYANHKFMTSADLHINMTVTAIIPDNVPMTMSIPPMVSDVVGLVVMDDTGFVNAGFYDENLFNKNALLVLDVAQNGIIFDMNGEHGQLTVNDIVNQNLLVLYKASTRSVPAQTSPDYVMILDGDYTLPVAEDAAEVEEAEDTEAVEMVTLREAAEAAGFTINWEANDKPVVLEKDGVSIELSVGEDTMKKGEETIELSEEVALDGSTIVIPADAVEYLK